MPDGTTLAIGCSRGKICQYDLRQLTSPVKTVIAHKGCVKCIRLQSSSTFSKVKKLSVLLLKVQINDSKA